MNYDLILKNISRHITLTEEEKSTFFSLLQHKKVSKKEILLRAGDVAKYTNFINRGCLRVYNVDEKGFVHIALFAIEDYWISDLYSFLTQTPASMYIDALEETEVFQITHSNMELLYQNVPKFERFFRIMHQNAFIAQHQRIMKKISATAEEQYFQFIKKYPKLETRISQKQIAAYLGITPEFLSMMKKKMLTQKS